MHASRSNITKEQLNKRKKLGLVAEDSPSNSPESNVDNVDKDEVLMFAINCPECNVPCQTHMKLVEIPFFKEVVLMATTCDACGFRENEVKGGSGIEPKGRRIKLRLTDISDLNRDVLKSDTCAVEVPELELILVSGTLGGRFTTVEGLLKAVHQQLSSSGVMGDSYDVEHKQKFVTFLDKLDTVISGKMLNVTVILDDPAGNSYMQNLYAPDPDPEMEVIEYERDYEQNDILGLNEMKTENYQS